jgi:hypothetical protein
MILIYVLIGCRGWYDEEERIVAYAGTDKIQAIGASDTFVSRSENIRWTELQTWGNGKKIKYEYVYEA